MSYDLILRHARVLDPSQGIDAVADVAVAGGRIAAVGPQLEASPECPERDLSGLYLCPGLVDLHGHWYEGSAFGIDPAICLNHGVTTVVDAGTTGFVNFEEFRRTRIENAPLRVLAFLNIAATGIPTTLAGELEDLRYARPMETAELLGCHPAVLVGVKVRIGSAMSGSNGLAALGLALEAAASQRTPVMVHISRGAETPEILRRLRPRDILTHCYQGRGDGLLLEDLILPEAREARANGVVFDVGHGCGSFSFDVARKAFEHFFYPDTISTDLHRYSVERFCFDLPTVMSKFLHLGMPLADVIAKTTCVPARVLGREGEIGTLRPGAQADLLVFSLDEGEFLLEDTHLQTAQAARRITPRLVMKDGKWVEPAAVRLRPLYGCDYEVFRRIEETA
jgi:dihydroorotase